MTGAIAAASLYRSPPAPADGGATLADATVAGDALVGFGLTAAGDITNRLAGVSADVGDWISPKVGMSDYECQATLVSSDFGFYRRGSVTGSQLRTWLSLAGSVEWKIQAGLGATATVTLTIEIRDRITKAPFAAATITLQSVS